MHLNPQLCFAEEGDNDGSAGGDESGKESGVADDVDSEAEESANGDDQQKEADDEGMDEYEAVESEGMDGGATESRSSNIKDDDNNADPLRWVFNRMSHMVVHKGEARRRAVFSWFGAMAAVHEPAVSAAHLKLMLLPLRRALLDAEAGGVEHKTRESVGVKGSASGPGGVGKEQTSAELATEVRC